MWIEKSKVEVVRNPDGEPLVTIDQNDYCPLKHIDVEIAVKMEAQFDGHHWPTEEERMERFFESAMPMLVKIWEEAHAT